MTITLVDYGMGNLGSVRNMLKKIGIASVSSTSPDEITKADKVILPGVGSFDHAVDLLQKQGIFEAISDFVTTGKPLLGICLGMQLLASSSEEGELAGFGFISGKSVKFSFPTGTDIKVPHMGWNSISPRQSNRIFDYLDDENRFYFVHSYHVVPDSDSNILASTEYGGEQFASMIINQNVIGAQFHPEKSHKFGMQMLRGFAAL